MAQDGTSRRTFLKVGGAAALAPVLTQVLGPGTAAADTLSSLISATTGATVASWPTISPGSFTYDYPATQWEPEALPIGNGRLGAMLFGGTNTDRIQFSEISLRGGANNFDNALAGQAEDAYDMSETGFGCYRDFGDPFVDFARGAQASVTAPGGPYQDSSSAETVAQTIDGRPDTKWCIIGPPARVVWQAELSGAAMVGGYSLTSANDVPERDPWQWTLAGSADGTNWVTLDQQTLASPFESRGLSKHFSFPTTASLRFYRITFVPRPGVSHWQVAEIALDGVDLAGLSQLVITSPSGHGLGRGVFDLAKTVDGRPDTYWSPKIRSGEPVTWQVQPNVPTTVSRYRVSAAGKKSHVDPTGWVLAGSNDGVTWTILDDRSSGVVFAGPGDTQAFEVAEGPSFAQVRLTFTAPAGASWFEIAEIVVVGSALPESATEVVDYARSLDLVNGVHTTRYVIDGAPITCQALISRSRDVLAVRMAFGYRPGRRGAGHHRRGG